MKFTSRFIATAALAVGLVTLGAAPAAFASNVNWSVGVGLPGVQLGLANPQRVYAPQVVYAQPAQVYGRPAPVYLQPQPVYVQPQVAYYPPAAYTSAYPQVYQQPYYGPSYTTVVRQPVVYAPAPVYRPWGHHHGFGPGWRGEYGGYGGGYGGHR